MSDKGVDRPLLSFRRVAARLAIGSAVVFGVGFMLTRSIVSDYRENIPDLSADSLSSTATHNATNFVAGTRPAP